MTKWSKPYLYVSSCKSGAHLHFDAGRKREGSKLDEGTHVSLK